MKINSYPFSSDLFIVIAIAPIIANSNINETIVKRINKLVYKILPIEVIWDETTIIASHDLLETLVMFVSDK